MRPITPIHPPTPACDAPRLLLVEDDAELVEMLAPYLRRDGFDVRIATRLAHATREIERARPDVAILDRMLPDGDGLDFCKRLRTSDPALPMLILTARGDPIERVLGLELGADDYLTKPFEPRELVARLRALLRRASVGCQSDGARLVVGRLTLQLAQRKLMLDGAEVPLTGIEFKLLLALARQPHRPLDRNTLAAAAQPGNYRPLARAVDVQIMRLRKKLSEAAGDGADELIQTVRGEGYVLMTGHA